ncbi:tRNA (adenosine(37)-N6)-threonylcarbamoyltransferase complex dimerization subunit type 1 TsaB [Alteromonas halophila]|uniref:tRNA threonylcarbamoyladenosine biosynthesis protein TsaB n=1 Tax=Alteromonas halophila TaxID=516698 RepID=A0A918N0N8_9ALTE|nr:tRNA (adenosine(37)-N6)-threonylcarbamoyltransferase complex dimerization subunit type 1 TsaB [Alteromonas halophila]GGW94818.1 tRNA threonylcarbamoyladenosine biosynthesis protein TsaB [Alteromonas halophila]
MNILAIDTATEACSVALRTSDQEVCRFEVCPQQHSQRLLPMVDEVLKDAGLTLGDVQLLAYGNGPGSFTGVRIATGMIQGLALGSALPVAGVSTLQAMAQQVLNETNATEVAVAIDARMGEVYFACFERKAELATPVIMQQVCSPEAAAAQLDGKTGYAKAGTGWEAYPALSALAEETPVSVFYPDARHMTALALSIHQRGDSTDALGVTPVYLRDKVTWKKLPGRE